MDNQNCREQERTQEVRVEGFDTEVVRKGLIRSIIDIDIKKFQQLLRSIDVSKRKEILEVERDSTSNSNKKSVFQYACFCINRPQFITECISAGCEVNKVNSEGKHPIKFIFRSFAPDSLVALLDNPCTDVDCIIDTASTPINFIISSVSDNNFNDRYACLKLLVEHCADVNIPDKNGLTPIQNVLQHRNLKDTNKKAIIKCFFDCARGIDVDGVREQLIEFMPNLALPPILNKDNLQWTVDRAIKCIEEFNEDEFIYVINRFAVDRTNDHKQLLRLLPGIITKKHWHFSLERVFRILKDNELNFKHIDQALNNAHWFYNSISNPTVKLCFDLIMRLPNINKDIRDPSVDILPPLNKVPSSRSGLILKFLERGVYITKASINSIDPDVLEKHFDRCITSNDKHIDDVDLLVTYDYTNLISKNDADEMSTITSLLAMSKSKHLLGHPLIASFLYLKWIKCAPAFYVNFFLTLFFASTTILYILTCFLNHTSNLILLIPATFFACCVIFRELTQFLISPRDYLKSYENYMEWLMIFVTSFILLELEVFPVTMEWRGTIAAASIILIAYEMFIFIGSLPFRAISMHFIMLETVTVNFLKFFSLFSIIVFAFAFSFYAAFHEQNLPNPSGNDTKSDDVYNNFGTLGFSMLKAFVMVTGELDTSSIGFKSSTCYMVFVAFILLVTTVLANLLVGLAVSDIGEIRSEVALTHSIRRCQFLMRYGKSMKKNYDAFKRIPGLTSLKSTFKVSPEFKTKFEYQIQSRMEVTQKKWWQNVLPLNWHPQMESEIMVESLRRIELHEKTVRKLNSSTMEKSNELMEKIQNMKEEMENSDHFVKDKLIQIGRNHDFVKDELIQIGRNYDSMKETMQKILEKL